jgi:nitrite reductase/ring-hydroxylating ferredoxin subunit/uncharacterized membrane protein
MRSRAHYKSHPIHPALIPFPFAFLSGALIFDAIGTVRGAPAFWSTATHLAVAGIVAGLLAAVPGLIDYLYSVPPASSGKKRAAQHAIGNVSALALFTAACIARGPGYEPGLLTLTLEFIGGGILGYSAWLGGTLVTRNLISVDHRYANAGKWQEAELTAERGKPLVVAHIDDLKTGQMKLLRINGQRVVLARTSKGYAVFDDRCTHRGGSLAGGVLVDETVHCLWHGSQFHCSTGAVTCGPATAGVRVYEVQESKGGQIVLASPPG